MARIKPPYVGPYVAWRDGRPRFKPGPTIRKRGFEDADLRHDDGRWFTLDEARGFAEARHAEIQSVIASGRKIKAPPSAPRATVEDLLEAFLKSGRFNRPREEGGYSAKTRDDYRKKANCLIWKPGKLGVEREEFALTPARALKPGMIHNDEDGGFYRVLVKERGLATARGAIMVLSAAYKWGRKAQGWQLVDNPCTRLGLRKSAPDVRLFSIEEFKAIVAYGDHPAIDEADLVDAVYVALFTGQRPSDVRALDGGGISDGVVRLVQSKRGKRVALAVLPPLAARLAAMKARREAKGWTAPALVIDHHTGKGFKESTLQHRFRALVATVAAGRPELGLAAVPSIAGKQVKHLRKTLLTWIKRAEVPDTHFAAVSGHSLASLPQVMPHYYTPGEAEAAEAMDAVWAWMQTQGMTG